MPNYITWDVIYPVGGKRRRERGWAVAYGQLDRHVTYRRARGAARRGPYRGRVQALVEDSYRGRKARR